MALSELERTREDQPFATIAGLAKLWSETHGDKVCFRYLLTGDVDGPTQTLSYGELWSGACSIAAELRGKGLEGERALFLYPHGLEFIKAFLGCLLARVVAVPLYHRKRARALEQIAEDSGAALIMTTRSLSEGLVNPADTAPSRFMSLPRLETDEICPIGRPGPDGKPQLDIDMGMDVATIPPDSLAFLQYTSGSTDRPKGVMVSHHNLVSNLAFLMDKIGACHRHLVMWLPFYHDMGLIGGLLWTVYSGLEATLLSPAGFLKRPYRWLRAVSKLGATTVVAPDFGYDLVVERTTREQRETLDLSALSLAINGAEPIRAETIERFSDAFSVSGFRPEAFFPCYGLAEATLLVTAPRALTPVTIESFDARLLSHGQALPAAGTSARVSRLVGCGGSAANQRLIIVDPETRRRLPDRRIGEIWLSGPCVASGYWNRAESGDRVFRARLADDDAAGTDYLRTGDLGFWHDGTLFITGRIKDVIILFGQNIYPQDLEGTVERTFAFVNTGACAAFVLDDHGSDQLVLLVEIPKARYAEANDIMDRIRDTIWQEHQLSLHAVVLLPRSGIPKTTSGKVRRFKCREQFLDAGFDEVARSVTSTGRSRPRTATNLDVERPPEISQDEMRSLLVDLLAEHTRVAADAIDIERPLYTYGLDSIRLLELTRALEIRLSCTLSPMTLYNHSSIDALARYLSDPQRAVEARATDDERGMRRADPAARNRALRPSAQDVASSGSGVLATMGEYELATRDASLRVCVWGPERGHTAICVHGIKDQGASWVMVARELTARGMRVVAPDLRGHGHSSHVTSYHLAGFLADISSVIEREFCGDVFTIVGHSMGAQVAALWATLRPEYVANLVLIEPPLEREHLWSSPLERIRMLRELAHRPYRHLAMAAVDDAAELIARAAPGMCSRVARALAERHTLETPEGVAWRWDAKLNAHYQSEGVFSADFSFQDLLAMLEVKVGVILGERGGAQSERAHELISGLNPRISTGRYILPGGHNLHLDCPIDVAAAIAREYGTLHED